MFTILEDNEEEEGDNDDVHAKWLGDLGGCCEKGPCPQDGDGDDIAARLKNSRAFHGTPMDKMLTRNAMRWADWVDEDAEEPTQCTEVPAQRTMEWAQRVAAQAMAREAGVPWLSRDKGMPNHFQGHPGV